MQAEQHRSTGEDLGTIKHVQSHSFLYTAHSKAVVWMVFDFNKNFYA